MRSVYFARRVAKELLRDVLSYIFCLGFPIFMLLLFVCINNALPAEARQSVFALNSITPGIGMFGLTFIMLFTALQVSRDRESSLLQRLFTSPMTAADFLLGYTAPILVLAAAQALICFAAGCVIGLFTGEHLSVLGCLRSIASLLPGALLFIALGLLVGSVMNDKAAPGVTSALITGASLLGGVWMPLEQMPGLLRVCRWLPFYPCVRAARSAMAGTGSVWGDEALVLAYAAVFAVLAVLAFRKKMKQ